MSGVTMIENRCHELWGICAYFNPLGYDRRLLNYREFRRHLSIPLVTVEIGYHGRFELDDNDADILIRCAGDDVLWQRERLWNLALQAVPTDCRKIARLDADILFESADWPHTASQRLDEFPLVQLFSEAYDQPAEAMPGAVGFPHRTRIWHSFAQHWQADRDCRLIDRRHQPKGVRSTCAMGLAWAFRRELHEQVDCDSCILGVEHVMLCAACGVLNWPWNTSTCLPPASRTTSTGPNAFIVLSMDAWRQCPGRSCTCGTEKSFTEVTAVAMKICGHSSLILSAT